MIAVVTDDAVGCHTFDDRRPAVGVSAEDKEGSPHVSAPNASRTAGVASGWGRRRTSARRPVAARETALDASEQRTVALERAPGQVPTDTTAADASCRSRRAHAAIRSAPSIRAYRPRIMSLTLGQPYDSALTSGRAVAPSSHRRRAAPRVYPPAHLCRHGDEQRLALVRDDVSKAVRSEHTIGVPHAIDSSNVMPNDAFVVGQAYSEQFA